MSMIIHFEIPADDLERAKTFYRRLFGWGVSAVPGRSNYLSVTADGVKDITGGIMKRINPKQTITNYIDVSSVDEYSDRIIEYGGKIVIPKKAVTGAGYFAICLDTERNIFGIWEESKDTK